MKLSETTDEVERFRAVSWKFQRTFLTPLKNLPHFVATFLSPFTLDQCSVTIEQVVFEPTNLLQLLTSHSITVRNCCGVTLTAMGQNEIAALLEAALGDWVDFNFVPTPESFAIFADHDEFTTFFSSSHSTLTLLTAALHANGFKEIPDYTRDF